MNTQTDAMKLAKTALRWDNGFHRLGPGFYTPLAPQALSNPYWVGRSQSAANLLGLDTQWMASSELLQAFTGNQLITDTQPLASVYSGHQFGQWAGQLGDGRAILLGEANGLEVQLKGSGLTPYSRMGDGRAVLRSSIREFLCSEAMHALGVPTTRALCVTGSDTPIRRETWETAAVVTRIAPSFVRFGHFEHFSAGHQYTELKTLADYVIDRYYPHCRTASSMEGNAYAALLQQVTERTAVMVANWQAVGFCHGVMNTDNMSILGLTMDYGPFQFMEAFDTDHICNHSDTQGRYAFHAQPGIAHWNLFVLGRALLPLIVDPTSAQQALDSFKSVFTHTFHQLMCAKLGLTHQPNGSNLDEVSAIITEILALLSQDRVDYPIFWRRLSHARLEGHFEPVRDLFLNRTGFDTWLHRYSALVAQLAQGPEVDLMQKSNPKFVLRNYLCEEAIAAAKKKDFSGITNLLGLISQPFDEHKAFDALAGFPPDWASQIEISCSS